MKYAVIESMTKIVHNGFTIRVWRDQSTVKDYYNNVDLVALFITKGPPITMASIVEALAKLDRVNAVEVTDADGNGTVVYTEWP